MVENIHDGIIEAPTGVLYPDDYVDETEIIDIGTKLLKIVKQIDASFAGMITNTYFVCMFEATATLYTALTIVFAPYSNSLMLCSTGCCSVAILCIFRLYLITNSVHDLSLSMRYCSDELDTYTFKKKDLDVYVIELLRQRMKCNSESPITPFSAFGVSTSTLVGVSGVITTYLIVLLQFKVSELSSTPQCPDSIHGLNNSLSNATY